MPAIHRYTVEITLIKKQVVAASPSEALSIIQDDIIAIPSDIEIKTVLVEEEK